MRHKVAGLLFTGFAVLAMSSLAAASPAVNMVDDGGRSSEIIRQLDAAIPDLIVVSSDSEADNSAELEELGIAITEAMGIEWVLVDATLTPSQLLVGFDPELGDQPLSAVEKVLAQYLETAGEGQERFTLTGRAVVDKQLNDTVNRSAMLATVVLAIAAGLLVGLGFDWRQGGAVAGVVLGSVSLASVMSYQMAGAFDGSLVTTTLPGMLAASVVSVVAAGRILMWFLDPHGDDQAEMIRKSVVDVGSELVVVLAGWVVLAGFLEWVDQGRSVASVSLSGAIVAGALVTAVLPPVLAVLVSVEGTAAPASDNNAMLAKAPPNGREFPLVVLAGFGLILVLLSAGSLKSTSNERLLDWHSLDDQGSQAVEQMRQNGDATGAILARFPDGTAQVGKTAWMENVSELDHVARVDSSSHRHVGGETEELQGAAGQLGAVAEDEEAPLYALVVPSVPARSFEALNMVEATDPVNLLVRPQMSGAPIDATQASERDLSVIWVTLIALALTGGVITLIVTGDTGLAGLSAGIRALGAAATVGLFGLVDPNHGGAEVLMVMFSLSMGATFFELSMFWRLARNNERKHDERSADEQIADAMRSEVAVAASSIGLLGVVGLALAISGLTVVSRMGLVLFAASAVELVLTSWMLRPALLGGRHIVNPLTRSGRQQDGASQAGSVYIDATPWVPIVTDLLQAEFAFQTNPSEANLDSLYLSGTPLFQQAVDHHNQLVSGGFSIVGRNPRLVDLKVVSVGEQAQLVATVVHPQRHLVDSGGEIVGVRNAERRSVMLWLAAMSDATYRMADSMEMGATSFEHDPESEQVVETDLSAQPVVDASPGHLPA